MLLLALSRLKALHATMATRRGDASGQNLLRPVNLQGDLRESMCAPQMGLLKAVEWAGFRDPLRGLSEFEDLRFAGSVGSGTDHQIVLEASPEASNTPLLLR